MTALGRAFLAIFLTASPVTAQTAPQAREPAPKTVEPSSMALAPEKHGLVKEYITRAKVPDAKVDGPITVGMTVPDGVEIWGLPQDSMTEVPTVTSYKFFHVGRTIAVVDPDSRKVIQVIQN